MDIHSLILGFISGVTWFFLIELIDCLIDFIKSHKIVKK